MKKVSIYGSILVLILFALSCESEKEDTTPEELPENITIWDGGPLVFSKAEGADPTLEANQDRITSNVHLTRGNNGGQIYNAVSESSANKDLSPAGTEWAFGSLEEITQLDFRPFRTAVGEPKDVVGKDLVMRIVAEDIYLSVRFTSWSQRRGGGFSYIRSTQ